MYSIRSLLFLNRWWKWIQKGVPQITYSKWSTRRQVHDCDIIYYSQVHVAWQPKLSIQASYVRNTSISQFYWEILSCRISKVITGELNEIIIHISHHMGSCMKKFGTYMYMYTEVTSSNVKVFITFFLEMHLYSIHIIQNDITLPCW